MIEEGKILEERLPQLLTLASEGSAQMESGYNFAEGPRMWRATGLEFVC